MQATMIPLAEIRENKVALRSVNMESEEYLQLVDSVRKHGILNAVTVRVDKDPESGADFFCLIDGLHRFTAAGDAGLEMIPAVISDADASKQLEMQITANLQKVATKPCEYAAQLKRMLSAEQTLTVTDLASKLSTTPKWIKDRLSLNKLENDRLRELIDAGEIPLANAYALAKLPAEEVDGFIEAAMTDPAEVFVDQVQARASEIRDARRKGKNAETPQFVPTPRMRKLKDLKELSNDPAAAQAMGLDVNTILWVLNLDPESIAAAKAQFDEREAAKAERARLRQEEKAKKKAEKAKKLAEEAQAASAALED